MNVPRSHTAGLRRFRDATSRGRCSRRRLSHPRIDDLGGEDTDRSPTRSALQNAQSTDRHPDIPFRDGRASCTTAIAATACANPKYARSSISASSASLPHEDLAEHAYAGDRDEWPTAMLQNLMRQGLVRKGTFHGPEANSARTAHAHQSGAIACCAQSPRAEGSGDLLTASSNPAKPITTPISIASIRKKQHGLQEKGGRTSASFSTYELKKENQPRHRQVRDRRRGRRLPQRHGFADGSRKDSRSRSAHRV